MTPKELEMMADKMGEIVPIMREALRAARVTHLRQSEKLS
jgi:hypothetical protein